MSAATEPSTKPDELSARLPSIRVRLLIVTSSVILLFVAILITLDYRREIRHHFDDKHADLMDEARTVLPGVLHLQNHGSEAVQKYIDSICNRMDDEDSPEHHIALTFGIDSFLQSDTSHPISEARLASIIAASGGSDSGVLLDDNDLLIAVYADGESTTGGSSALLTRRGMEYPQQ